MFPLRMTRSRRMGLYLFATVLMFATTLFGGGVGTPNSDGQFFVDAFGAKGDAKADDTAAIQAAVDAAGKAGGAAVVFRGGATYMVTSVNLMPGITLEGNGATVRRPDKASEKSTRTFTTTGHLWINDADSPPLVIRGLTLDGNRQNQGAYKKYEIEQAHLLFLMGAEAPAAKKGRLRAIVENCTFKDSPADAISVYTNVAVQISNCTSIECFRHGITVIGGNSSVQVNNFIGRGEEFPSGLHWEVDGKGFGDSYATDSVIHGATLDGHFAVELGGGSRFMASGILCRTPSLSVYAPGSTVRISDSVFSVGILDGYLNRVTHPSDVTFANCRFVASAVGAPPAGKEKRKFGLMVQWNINGTAHKGLRLRLIDCDFSADATVGPDDETYGVHTTPDVTASDNRLVIDGGDIAASIRNGVYVVQGGRVQVKGMRIAAATGIFFGAPGEFASEIELDDVMTSGAVSIHCGNPNPKSILTCRNMQASEAQSTLATTYGLDLTQRGGRVIDVDTNPSERMGGLAGDRARLIKPVAGETYEWICLNTGLGKAAVWKPLREVSR